VELLPGDRVRVTGLATLPCIWYGPNHTIDDPASLVGLHGTVVTIWRTWLAVDVEGEQSGSWWIEPAALELL
jgi:hypothetical protein